MSVNRGALNKQRKYKQTGSDWSYKKSGQRAQKRKNTKRGIYL
jgi:hypothetical protein